MIARRFAGAFALALLCASAACTGSAVANSATADTTPATIPLKIVSANGVHKFRVERAGTVDEQQRGLMFRTNIPADHGMLFWPYPPEGGPPRDANFWMKNTPSPLDIIFIRADGTIAHIAENAVPFDESPIPSGEPIGAVLEINGGKAGELGIAEGDRVTWSGRGRGH